MKSKSHLRMWMALFVGAFAAVSCTDAFDDTKLWGAVDDLEGRVSALEAWQKSVNEQIGSIQTVVDAWETGKTITNVSENSDGYTITFSDGTSISLKNGNGLKGDKGEDGKTPIIGVKEDGGVLYWTVDGEFLLNNGEKVPVTGKDGKDGQDGQNGKDGQDGQNGQNGQNGKDGQDGQNGKDGQDGQNGKDGQDGQNGKDGQDGQNGKDGVTPQLRINSETYYWEVSVDGGLSWQELTDETGSPVSAKGEKGDNGANGADGDSFFKSVDVDDEAGTVSVTLADGTQFTLKMETGRVLYFTNPGKQLDYDMDEDGHYTGLRSTTLVCTLPEEEISAVMAQLLYPDENGDIVTRADKKVRIDMPAEWEGQFKVYVDVQETLKAILEVRVAAMDGTEYVAARQLDTTPLIEFVEYSNGVTVQAPNTFSAEVKLKFVDGISKVKRLAIAALPTTTVQGSYEGYDSGTEFRRTAQICFGYFEKGKDLDPYIAIPYYVYQGEELTTGSDGYLHVDEDKLLFYANVIDGEYVYQQATTPFRAGVNYTVATFVEYKDGGFDLINTEWTVPDFEYGSELVPTFTQDPVFVGTTATAKVTAEGAAKLATFVVDDDGAFNENRLAYYLNSYDNRFHAYTGEKEFSFTTNRLRTYTFVAVAIDQNGKIGKPVTRDVTYGATYGEGPEITAVELEQQTELNKLVVKLTADEADEVRFLTWDYDTWMTNDDRGSRQSDASKLESYFETFNDFMLTNTFKKESGKWISRYPDGITLSLAGVTTPGFTDDTTGEEDERTEVPATGGGQFLIFFNALKDGSHGDIYALYGNYDKYELVNVTDLGYDEFTAAEAAKTYVYTTAYPEELAGGGEGEDNADIWSERMGGYNFSAWYYAAVPKVVFYASPVYAGNYGRVWAIKLGHDVDTAELFADTYYQTANIREKMFALLEPNFSEYATTGEPNSTNVLHAYAQGEFPTTYAQTNVGVTLTAEIGDLYALVAEDTESEMADGKYRLVAGFFGVYTQMGAAKFPTGSVVLK